MLLGTDAPRWGLEIIKLTGRPSGSVYPLLDRLERAGWVTSAWDDDVERKGAASAHVPVHSRGCCGGASGCGEGCSIACDFHAGAEGGAMKTALALVRFAAAVIGDERYREQWEADVVGARQLGMSPLRVAFGALVAVVVMPSKGAVVAGIGLLGIALNTLVRRVGGCWRLLWCRRCCCSAGCAAVRLSK